MKQNFEHGYWLTSGLCAPLGLVSGSEHLINLTGDLSLARIPCETNQVLLSVGQVVFLRDLSFSPHLTLTWLKMREMILTG